MTFFDFFRVKSNDFPFTLCIVNLFLGGFTLINVTEATYNTYQIGKYYKLVLGEEAD